MSDPTRDSLDEAIDRVATGMVSMDVDVDAARRIAGTLPNRHERRFGSSSLLFQAATIAAAALVVFYVRSFSRVEPAKPVFRDAPVAVQEPTQSRVEASAAVEPPQVAKVTASTRRPAPGLTPAPPAIEIDAIETPEELTIPSLETPTPLVAVGATAVAPISITELPLSSDGASPFFRE